MITKPLLPDSEKAIRIEATSPALDAWVSANAGSGKTTILRNRVIRLLLEGVPPDRILCLTFTKAAAAEMQGRIFAELARWVTLDDAALKREIAELSTIDPAGFSLDTRRLTLARTLFARAIEAPGGLKIQTIHAFAERVLHLFPLESGVPIDFTVLGEQDAIAMRHQARQEAIEAAIREEASPLGRAFGEILAAAGTDSFAKALDTATKALSGLRMRGEAPPDPATREAAYRRAFNVPKGETPEKIEADFAAAALSAGELERASEASVATKKPGKMQIDTAADFKAVAHLRAEDGDWNAAYLNLFLTTKLEARAKVFQKPVTDAYPEYLIWAAAAQQVCLAYIERKRALSAFNRSLALLVFAEFGLDRFVAAKRAQNALDFDDLIAALRRLLLSGQSSWIMLKLDSAIEHVLIDEAQDTTREMWDIVRGLTEEFFAGEGKVRRSRSVFVVGDEKQSIFSFQGADPAVFEESRQYFAEKSLTPKNIRTPVALNYSFRSSTDILNAVDAVFAAPEFAEGLTASGQQIKHEAARQKFPGLVELWPPERPPIEDVEGGEATQNRGGAKDSAVLLADRIADQIGGWLESGACHLADGKRIEAGDIVILVRQRNGFFSAMLRALKMRKIPVAGADRLKLQDEIAIRDFLVIGEAALLKSDDLALATALKSPLFGVSDKTLEVLARNRKGTLWNALQGEREDPLLQRCAMKMARLALDVRVQSPFEFFSSLLIQPAPAFPAMSGRKAVLTRLGLDAADPIDAFLNEAQEFPRSGPGSVLLFVLAQRTRETEIKRDLDQGGSRVRIMTVHGAKGLEGRIVFLGDTVDKPRSSKEDPAFLIRPDKGEPLLVWAGPKAEEPAVMREERRTLRRKLLGEYRRLLYVGMTRAADRLYVGGYAKKLSDKEIKAGKEKSSPDDPMEWSWYHLMQAGLTAMPGMVDVISNAPARQQEADQPRVIRRLISAVPSAPRNAGGNPEVVASEPPPAWLTQSVPREAQPQPPLRPSKVTSLAALSEEAGIGDAGIGAGAFARRRGIVLHQLYEWLPRVEPALQLAAGKALLQRLAPELGESDIGPLLASVIAVLASPERAAIFGPDSRAEIAISGRIPLPDGSTRTVSARIDRLVVREASIEIIDLKTGKPHPAADDGTILRQMALYRGVLQAIYPGRTVTCTVLWTENGTTETLPDAALDAALERITSE